MTAGDHWNDHARQWGRVGVPLRPDASDVRLAEQWMRGVIAEQVHSPCAVLLGVTPELVSMTWPERTRLMAVDRSVPMIRGVFPERSDDMVARAVCGDWLKPPLPDGCADVVVGDGCYTLLPDAGMYSALGQAVRRVLRGGGHYMMRFFIRPELPETVEQVFSDLLDGHISGFHAFKWRLAMALHEGLDRGVSVNRVWEEWQEARLDVHELAGRTGWHVDEIRTIDAYRGSTARYTFPTLEEARGYLGADFEEIACHFPDYELGERCPTLLLRRS